MKSINKLKETIKTNLNTVSSEDMLNILNELEKYKKLEEEGKLIEFPCKIGDYARFSDGSILPVIYLTKSNNGDIVIGCQNGITVSMKHLGLWLKEFIPREEYKSKYLNQ